MDAEQLWETTMDPEKRILLRVTMDEDQESEIDVTFTTLMGDKVVTAAVMRGIPVAEYAPRKAKIAICGNGAASKEQVSMMIQKTLKVDLDPKHLDATDALAIALCHHYQMSNPLAGTAGKTDWKKFLENNPDRIKK